MSTTVSLNFHRRRLAITPVYTSEEIEFVVPDLFWAEIANARCKGVRLGMEPRYAEEGIANLAAFDFYTVPSRLLLREDLPIALNFAVSIYDCLYVALALQVKTDLITADERLATVASQFR